MRAATNNEANQVLLDTITAMGRDVARYADTHRVFFSEPVEWKKRLDFKQESYCFGNNSTAVIGTLEPWRDEFEDLAAIALADYRAARESLDPTDDTSVERVRDTRREYEIACNSMPTPRDNHLYGIINMTLEQLATEDADGDRPIGSFRGFYAKRAGRGVTEVLGSISLRGRTLTVGPLQTQ